jgi:hypothetical protein
MGYAWVLAVGVTNCFGIEIEVVGIGCCAMLRLSAVIGCAGVPWLVCAAPHAVNSTIKTRLIMYQNFRSNHSSLKACPRQVFST